MSNIEINLTPTASLLEIGTLNKIPCRSWGIASESGAAFLLVHGLGGHSGWFEAFARRLKIKHIFVLALDLGGFGKNKNNVGMNNWLEDIDTAAKYLNSVMGSKPIFLVGNSMGGLLALCACQRVRPSGLALLSPAFAGHPKLFSLPYQIKELIKALIKPKSQVVLPYGTELITKEEQIKTWLDKDKDRRHTVAGKTLVELLFLTRSLQKRKINLDCPILLLTAGADKIVDNKASEFVFKQINSPDKKMTNVPNAMHDLTLDVAIEQVADMLADWSSAVIQARVPKGKSHNQGKVS